MFVGTAIGSVLRYGFQVIVGRQLGAEAFGLWTLGFIVFKIAVMGAEFGLPQGIIRYVAAFRGEGRMERARGIIRSGTKIGLISGLFFAGLMLVFSGPISVWVFHRPEISSVIRLFALAVPFATLTTAWLSATQGCKTMVPTMVVREVFEPFFRVLLVGGAFAAGLRLIGPALAYVLAAVGAMSLSWRVKSRLDFPSSAGRETTADGSSTSVRLLLDFGWPLFLIQIMGFIIQWTGTILLGIFRSPAEVGIFGAVVKTSLLGGLSRNAFHSVFSPIVAEMDSQGRSEAMGLTYRTVSKWVFSVNFPFFLGLIMFARPVLRLFGGEFVQGGLPLIILSLGWIVYSSVGPVGETLTMTGRQRLNLLNMAGCLVVTLAISFWLVPSHGTLGAAIGFSMAMVCYDVAAVVQIRRLAGIRPFPRTLWKPAAAGILAAGIVSAGRLVPALRAVYEDLPACLAGGAVFALLDIGFLMLFGLDEEDRRILSRIKSRIIPSWLKNEDDLS